MLDIFGKVWAVSEVFGRAIRLELNKDDGMERISREIAQAKMNRPAIQFMQIEDNKGIVERGLEPNVANGRETIGAQPEAQEEKYVAVLPVMGVLTRDGEACSWGTEDISRWLTQCENNEMIAGVILNFDSPGGAVNGIEQLGEQIAGFKKPIRAFVRNTCASGAYWLASQCPNIWVEKGVGKVLGSIGVYTVHGEMKTYEEKNGIKWEMIRASTSPDKAKGNPWEPMDAVTREEIIKELDLIHKRFCDKVAEGRGDRLKEFEMLKKGKVYVGAEAIKYGLADKTGNLEDVAKEIFKAVG